MPSWFFAANPRRILRIGKTGKGCSPERGREGEGMHIKEDYELQGMRAIGAVVASILGSLARRAAPGRSTLDLDSYCSRLLIGHGARSAMRRERGFPGHVCISVNDEVIHGIPSDRLLQRGDVVSLDLVAEKDGFYADAAVTLALSRTPGHQDALIRCAERSLEAALEYARAGCRISDLTAAIHHTVTGAGFSVIPELCGHGVGRSIHEPPVIPNCPSSQEDTVLYPGLVLALEPVITEGGGATRLASDGWTVTTADGSLAAHYEHTILITEGDPEVLTLEHP